MPRKPKKPPKPGKRGKCSEKVAVCRNPSCRWRFDAADGSKTCKKCGEPRACQRDTEPGERKCFIHGGKTAQLDGFKIAVPLHLAKAWNRILSSPNLMSMAENQALAEVRLDQLMRMIEEADSRGAHQQIMAITAEMEVILLGGPTGVVDMMSLRDAMHSLLRALEPVNVESALWREALQVQEVVRRTNDTERKWNVAEQDCLPVDEVFEALKVHARLSLKFITDPADRARFAAEFRQATPWLAAPK